VESSLTDPFADKDDPHMALPFTELDDAAITGPLKLVPDCTTIRSPVESDFPIANSWRVETLLPATPELMSEKELPRRANDRSDREEPRLTESDEDNCPFDVTASDIESNERMNMLAVVEILEPTRIQLLMEKDAPIAPLPLAERDCPSVVELVETGPEAAIAPVAETREPMSTSPRTEHCDPKKDGPRVLKESLSRTSSATDIAPSYIPSAEVDSELPTRAEPVAEKSFPTRELPNTDISELIRIGP
jgi:hypothetical protein